MGRTLPPVSEIPPETPPKLLPATVPPAAAVSRSVDLGVGWESFTEENRALRNGFLEYVQAHPLGSKPLRRFQRKKKILKEPLPSTVSQKPSFITFSYPRYISRDIVVPAPSDMVTLEVGLTFHPTMTLRLCCLSLRRCGLWLPFCLSSTLLPSSPS
jgi:hypothetical protein